MNYSPQSHKILRTMYHTLVREGVDLKRPPVELQPAGPKTWRHYSHSTVKLLRWTISVINKHGTDFLADIPSPSAPTRYRTADERSQAMAETWAKLKAGDPVLLSNFIASQHAGSKKQRLLLLNKQRAALGLPPKESLE